MIPYLPNIFWSTAEVHTDWLGGQAIFPENTNFKFITKIHTGLIEADDNNAINLVLNAETIFPYWIYLKLWKDSDKVGA